MKKIVYSAMLKLTAVILLIASVTLGVLTVSEGIVAYFDEERSMYSFESDFSESWYLSHLLNEPGNAVLNAYISTFPRDGHGGDAPQDDLPEEGSLEANIQKRFRSFYLSDEINYYVQWNDLVLTNCGAVSAEELMQAEYHACFRRDGGGRVETVSSAKYQAYTEILTEEMERSDGASTLVIACSIKEEAVVKYRTMWEKQEGIVMAAFIRTLACAVAALLLLIYLICVCGKDQNGEYRNLWIDHIWIELHMALIGGSGLGATMLCLFVLDEYLSGNFPFDWVYPLLGVASALASLIIVTSLLSVIRNIKTRRLTETSIVLRVLRRILRLAVRTVKWTWKLIKSFCLGTFGLLSKKTSVILVVMLFVYTALIGALGIAAVASAGWLIAAVFLFGFACFIVAYRAKDLEEIQKGVREVRGGNTAYQIPALKCDDLRALAENVNGIAKGLDESVSAKIKAERLKTELITNVSHDLKTPITSIINYTELLSNVEDLPQEARDYVSVVSKKAERLKTLTQDLFDISKAQSGNDEVVLEKLDTGLLIQQALGEHDGEIRQSGLTFCTDVSKDLYISADGRKMSRVLSNLLGNVLKYAMKGTRVFISAAEKEESIEIVFKNISAYPLNFSAEEITGRFVRGDESRTAEGNGLGLAIAKSYTELCGGNLEIVIDGDLFKAILTFKKIS